MIMNHHISDYFKTYLFTKHLFISDSGLESSEAAEVLSSLSRLFHIRVTEGGMMADVSMIRLASSELGSQAHPDVKERSARLAFREDSEVKEFRIINSIEAHALLTQAADDLLQSSRPLSESQYQLVLHAVTDLHFVPACCHCKSTAYRLLLDTFDLSFSRYFSLPDVLKFAEYLCYRQYGIEDGRKLRLSRRYRKLIIRILDRKLSTGEPDLAACCERQKIWCGLLHCLHYQPSTEAGRRFVKAMREGPNLSVYSRFEAALKMEDIKEAVGILIEGKGVGTVLRHATYLLSRCHNPEEIDYVIEHMGSANILLYMQLLIQYDHYSGSRDNVRFFHFMRNGRLCIHRENADERSRRRSWLPEGFIDELPFMIRNHLERSCHGTLGSVYVDPAIVDIAMPLQAAGSLEGYGVLPKGTAFRLNPRKVVRAFMYGKGAFHFSLNVLTFTDDCMHYHMLECGRYGYRSPNKHIQYHDVQVSDYDGWAEFVDIDLQGLSSQFPDVAYVLIEASVFADEGVSLESADCHAGFMQRDRITSGEAFEPRTVETNFRVTGNSMHLLLFGLDLKRKSLVWLNRTGYSHEFPGTLLSMQKSFNMFDFFCLLAEELTDDPMQADVVVSDKTLPHKPDACVIHSYDTEKILALETGDGSLSPYLGTNYPNKLPQTNYPRGRLGNKPPQEQTTPEVDLTPEVS